MLQSLRPIIALARRTVHGDRRMVAGVASALVVLAAPLLVSAQIGERLREGLAPAALINYDVFQLPAARGPASNLLCATNGAVFFGEETKTRPVPFPAIWRGSIPPASCRNGPMAAPPSAWCGPTST